MLFDHQSVRGGQRGCQQRSLNFLAFQWRHGAEELPWRQRRIERLSRNRPLAKKTSLAGPGCQDIHVTAHGLGDGIEPHLRGIGPMVPKAVAVTRIMSSSGFQCFVVQAQLLQGPGGMLAMMMSALVTSLS